MTQRIKVIVLLTLLKLTIEVPNLNEDDPHKIETKSYEYYLSKISDDVRNRCELDEMYAYQMTGDAENVQEGNELCPNNGP